MGEVRNPRRYYLLQAQFIGDDVEDEALKLVWWGKQEAIAGTAVPLTFPFRAELDAIHYRALEDLDGADQAELINQGLPYFKAKAVLEAFAEI